MSKTTKKPLVQNLKGFRDFLPGEKRARDFVAEKIVETFENFGFEPLETPTLEYASLLTGKYGEEADKLVYTFKDKGKREIGLRYDQTVPTARILTQYQNDLPRYFRRYQIQNVFRADKPQKGRFREFTQCDIDIFGSTSPVADAEILACTYFAYQNVGFPNVDLYINDRQVLMSTLSPFASPKVDVFSIIQSIDKLDKQSPQEVQAELVSKGLTKDQAVQALAKIEKAEISDNLQEIVDRATDLGIPKERLIFNPKLARGLDYYTGMIFEVILPEYKVGSVGGGGRYDNLIGDLSGRDLPAVGIAFGFDRMVEAATEMKLLEEESDSTAQVLVALMDEETVSKSLEVAGKLRQEGVTTEVYPTVDKLGKQFKLADEKQIPYVIVIGEKELKENKVSLKNLANGEQKLVTVSEAIARLKA